MFSISIVNCWCIKASKLNLTHQPGFIVYNITLFLLFFSDDDCPTRFNNGQDPYRTELAIYVLGGSVSLSANALVLLTAMMIVYGLHK